MATAIVSRKAAPKRPAETPQKSPRAHETTGRAEPERGAHVPAISGLVLLRLMAGFYSAVDIRPAKCACHAAPAPPDADCALPDCVGAPPMSRSDAFADRRDLLRKNAAPRLAQDSFLPASVVSASTISAPASSSGLNASAPVAITSWTPRRTSPFGPFYDSIVVTEIGRMACGDSRGSGISTSAMAA